MFTVSRTQLLTVLAVLLLIAVAPSGLRADSVLIRNGQTLRGLILDVGDDVVKLQLPDGQIQSIETKHILRLQYDLGGLRICYTRLEKSERVCSALLRRWSKDAITIVSLPDYRKEETIALEDLREVEVWVTENQNIMHYFAGVELVGEIELRDAKLLKGKIRQDGSNIRVSRFLLSDTVPGTSISRISLKKDMPAREPERIPERVPERRPAREPEHVPERLPERGRKLRVVDFYPGYRRLSEDGYFIGGGMMTLFTGSALASAYFASAASQQNTKAAGDLSTILFFNDSYLHNYQTLHRQSSAAGFFALGLFLLNSADVLWLGKGNDDSSMRFQIYADFLGPREGFLSASQNRNGDRVISAAFTVYY